MLQHAQYSWRYDDSYFKKYMIKYIKKFSCIYIYILDNLYKFVKIFDFVEKNILRFN